MRRYSLRRFYSRRTPPTTGLSLERERKLEGLTPEEVGAFYSGRRGAERVLEIEAMGRVPQRIEIAYRAALGTAKTMRGCRQASDFEILKINQAFGR
jgi:hypothetical protein